MWRDLELVMAVMVDVVPEYRILSTRKLTRNVQKKMWHCHLSITIMWLDHHQCGMATNNVQISFICPTGFASLKAQ